MIAGFGRGARRLLLREAGVAMSAARGTRPTCLVLKLGNMSMAIAGRAPSGGSASRGARSDARGFGALSALAKKLLALSALSLAMALAGCAQNSAQHEVKADPVEAAAPAQGQPDFRIRRPNRALLVSQPAPDCEFRGTELKTVDPDQWARLKLDYERQCYQQAEKKVRDRLRLLQASSRCEIEPVRPPLATIR
jgi:hypothetical protein